MKIDITRGNQLTAFGAVLAQAPTLPAEYIESPTSYAEAWERLFSTCTGWLGETECKRLLGYTPFVCPVPSERPLTANWWFWLGLGAAAGLVATKLVL